MGVVRALLHETLLVHELEHWEHCLRTQSLIKKKQLMLSVAYSASRCPASGEVSISECDAT